MAAQDDGVFTLTTSPLSPACPAAEKERPLAAVPRYPGYLASARGEVYSTLQRGKLKPPQRLSPYVVRPAGPGARQHRFVKAYRARAGRKVQCSLSVAEAVLSAFVGPRPSRGHVAWHRDLDTLNDGLDNLVWVSREEFLELSGAGRPRHRSTRKGAKLNEHTAPLVRRAVLAGEMTPRQAALRVGCTVSNIGHLVSGRSWGHVTDAVLGG